MAKPTVQNTKSQKKLVKSPHIFISTIPNSPMLLLRQIARKRVTGMAESTGQVLPAKKCLRFLVVSFQTAATLVSFQEKVALVTTLLLILLWITVPICYRDTVSTALTVDCCIPVTYRQCYPK